jgi:KDO2-lipid IV(A) lauroyltransferase
LAGLTRCAEASSIESVVARGAFVGRRWAQFGLPRTRRVREQLSRAFPEIPEAERERWVGGVFEHFGRSLAELILLRGRHRETLLARVEVQGLDHLEAAEAQSATGGVLLVSAHYGNWELGGVRVASLGVRLSAVFRGLARPVLDTALKEIRSAPGDPWVDYQPIRMGRAGLGVVRALKGGRKILVLLDQDAHREPGFFVSFFGRPARVRTGPLRLARRRGIPIVPVFIRRDAETGRHRIRIHPALLQDESPAAALDAGVEESGRTNPGRASDPAWLAATAQRITALIEAEIREDPTQWIWTHRRWRSQPHPSETPPPEARPRRSRQPRA